MKYLMIENSGEADVRAFTIFGLSTARGNSDLIGQFGSGSKHAINVMLRHNIDCYIYSGTNKFEFTTEQNIMNGSIYNQVFIKENQSKRREAGWALEFGSQDWTHISMGLREFISNAIDACGSENVNIEVTDKPRAKSNKTRIFVEYTSEVEVYFKNINHYFLHWGPNKDKKFIPNTENTQANIYRKGVLVGKLQAYQPCSLFHYNLDDELVIDESRNINDWQCSVACAKALSKDRYAIETLCSSLLQDRNVWEHSFNKHNLEGDGEIWKESWNKVAGDKVICDDAMKSMQLTSKGIQSVIIKKLDMFAALAGHGIVSSNNKLSPLEQRGHNVVDTSKEAKSTLDRVWGWLNDIEMTGGKNKPDIKCFSSVDDGHHLFGYYEDETVFMNICDDSNTQTMLEECSHYVTGAEDNSRIFQEFAFNVANRMAKILFD